jgi:hypothetical protein
MCPAFHPTHSSASSFLSPVTPVCDDAIVLYRTILIDLFLISFARLPVPNDCGRLVTCVNDYPRLISCGYGSAFNEDTLTCDDAENVPQWCVYQSDVYQVNWIIICFI